MAVIKTKIPSVFYKDTTYDVVIDFMEIDKNNILDKTFPLKVFLNLKEKTIGWRCDIEGRMFGDYKKF